MKLPCLYIQQPGLASNIGLPAVPKLVLAMALRPPRTLPSVNISFSNSAAASLTTGESNLVSFLTHLLYSSGPP